MIHWRPYVPDDYEAVRALLVRHVGHARDLRVGAEPLVLVHDDRVVGCTMLINVLHMEPTAIDAAYRTVGVMTQMAAAVRSRAETLGAAVLFAFTSNERIGKLMTAFGFEELSTWRVFRRILGKELNEQLIRRTG
jgi:N-acetylglutamate synthase-like GNAT family acetyltransferase